MNIQLEPDDIFAANELADGTYQKYKDHPGHYRNLLSSHIIGKLGEMAAYKYFKQNHKDVTPHFLYEEQDQLCDITVDGIRWDIKTWNTKYWAFWGRAVSVNQLQLLVNKADKILWTSVDPDNPQGVDIYGWNDVSEIAQFEPAWMGPEGRQVLNHQVPLDKMHQI